MLINNQLHQKLALNYQKRTGHVLKEPLMYKVAKDIYHVGQTPKGIYYILEGKVKVVRDGNGDIDPVVELAGPNEFIGFLALIGNTEYTVSAVVVEEAIIQFIPKPVFLELMKTDVEFANTAIGILCNKIDQREERIVELVAQNAEERLATFLLSLDRANDELMSNDSYLTMPKKEMAHIVGISPETMSRYLSKLEKSGVIARRSKGIEILKRNELLKLCNVKD